MKPKVQVFENLESLGRAAAAFTALRAAEAVSSRGRFTLVLSGGSTPKRLFECLAAAPHREKFPWSSTFFFWGDERFVGPEHPESNYGMARQALLDKVPADSRKVFPVPTSATTVELAAERYAEQLKSLFAKFDQADNIKPDRNFPVFDLVLSGLGADGHTASLFPGSLALAENRRWTAAVTAPAGYTTPERVTLTLPVINSAACVLFLATGAGKKKVVSDILGETEKAFNAYPAARVRPLQGELFWFLDRRAAPDP